MMMFAYNLASFDYARAAVVANPACCPMPSRKACASTPRPSASAAA